MNSFSTLTLLFTGAILLTTLIRNGNAEGTCRTLDAAFYFESSLFLVSGEDYYEINSDLAEVDSGKVTDRFSDAPAQIDAACIWSGDETLYFFQGAQYYYYSNWFNTIYGPYPNSRWTPFFIDGIDGAAWHNDKTYFFKGCEYITYDVEYSEIRPMHELGLPCDIDAALDHGDLLVVVKGAKSWAVNNEGNVRGPVDLTSVISLTSADLCESDSSTTFSEDVQAELLHETVNDCVILDAAITYKGVVYLFNNDSYIRLDADGNEERLAKNYEWGGLGSNIAAAISVRTKSTKTYFFQGDQYYKYSLLALGPFSSDSWASVFTEGIDAAGSRQGMSYFFQGCNVIHFDFNENEVSEILKSEELGLPCDVDAAFSKDDDLYVIKGDRVWIWGAEVQGPGPISEVVHTKSWNICP